MNGDNENSDSSLDGDIPFFPPHPALLSPIPGEESDKPLTEIFKNFKIEPLSTPSGSNVKYKIDLLKPHAPLDPRTLKIYSEEIGHCSKSAEDTRHEFEPKKTRNFPLGGIKYCHSDFSDKWNNCNENNKKVSKQEQPSDPNIKKRKLHNSSSCCMPSSSKSSTSHNSDRKKEHEKENSQKNERSKEDMGKSSQKSFDVRSQQSYEHEASGSSLMPPPRMPPSREPGCSSWSKPLLEYRSDELSVEERDHIKCLNEAKRLKHLADRETATTKRCILYMESVIYYLLTGYGLERDSATEKDAYTMYNDTLNLIKYVSSKVRILQNTSSLHNKMAILNLKCQAFLHYKLFKMRKREITDNHKIVQDYCVKTANLPSLKLNHINPGGSSQKTPLSLPSTSSGFGSVGGVGGVGLLSNCGGSGELARRNLLLTSAVSPAPQQGVLMPLHVLNEAFKQSQNASLLLSCGELWKLADYITIKGQQTEFFEELDHHCIPPILSHTSLIDLIRYMRAGIEKMKRSTTDSN